MGGIRKRAGNVGYREYPREDACGNTTCPLMLRMRWRTIAVSSVLNMENAILQGVVEKKVDSPAIREERDTVWKARRKTAGRCTPYADSAKPGR